MTRIRTLLTGFVTATALLLAGPASAEDPPLVDIKRLSLEMAQKAVSAAIDQCREEGVQVAVAVIDRGGHVQAQLRDVLAMDVALEISERKAYTALSFNTPTSQMSDRFSGAYQVPKLDRILLSGGGLPITAAGNIVGGIGVSGAPSSEIDEKCAQAGLDAIQADLEMAAF